MVKKQEKKPVLIIEDDTGIRNFVARVLELEGYLVLQSGSGEQGIEIARKNLLALVLLDLRLPGHDGWAVLEELKNDPALSTIPVMVLTATAAAPQRARALHLGATDYLVKPLSAQRLKTAVARILSRKG